MKSPALKILLAIVCLVSASLACNAITNPGLGGGGDVPTENPGGGGSVDFPTATPDESGGNTSFGEVQLSDDFSDSGTGWGTGTDSDSSVEYVNGGLQFAVFTAKYFTWSTPNLTAYENIHIETTVSNSSNAPESTFGIICHEQGTTSSFYYLGVAADGSYVIAKSAVAQDDVNLAEGNSDLIPSGSDPFTIGADCGTGNLALYVNGQQVASAQDSTYTSGSLGLFAASVDQPASASVTFDDILVTSLP